MIRALTVEDSVVVREFFSHPIDEDPVLIVAGKMGAVFSRTSSPWRSISRRGMG